MHDDPFGDPFGEAYRLGHAGGGRPGSAHLVFELANGYCYAQDVAEYFTGADTWWECDRIACGRVAGRVLDIGCGPGRHSAPLARDGHDIVGIDTSPGAVALARDRGVRAEIGGVPDDLPAGLGTFDTFLMLGANLGLLGDTEHRHRVLRALAGLARPGAQLLGSNVTFPARPPARPPSRSSSGDATGAARPGVAARATVPGLTSLRVRHGFAASPWHDFLGCPPRHLADAVAGTGWRVEEVREDSAAGSPAYLAQLRLVDRP
ncbi:class I SAM-dependent methyltransferase [Streptomyces sp. NPDC056730]|uniref:class I SAM-dependent methyltransferase n=1 Tax=unclassified Streptomyces TaxID=2593676 RepID=UPI0036554563